MSIKTEKIDENAKIFAKILVNEIKEKNESEIIKAIKNKDLYQRLKKDIDKGQEAYNILYRENASLTKNYFYEALVEDLAEGDIEILGKNYTYIQDTNVVETNFASKKNKEQNLQETNQKLNIKMEGNSIVFYWKRPTDAFTLGIAIMVTIGLPIIEIPRASEEQQLIILILLILLLIIDFIALIPLINKSIIKVTDNHIIIRPTPIPVPWLWKTSICIDNVDKIYCKEVLGNDSSEYGSGYYLYYQIKIKLKNNKEVQLLRDFNNKEEAEFLANNLEKILKLEKYRLIDSSRKS